MFRRGMLVKYSDVTLKMMLPCSEKYMQSLMATRFRVVDVTWDGSVYIAPAEVTYPTTAQWLQPIFLTPCEGFLIHQLP